MLHVRNFESADELMAHYRALKNKPVIKKLQPVKAAFRQIYLEPAGPAIPDHILQERERIAAFKWQQKDYTPVRTKAQNILLEVCEEFDVTLNDLRSPRRFVDLVYARRKAYWRLKNDTPWSLPQIGRFVGKDHTTVLHGIRRFELDALHKRNDFPMATTREFKLYEQSGCRASVYLAAREAGK